MAGVAKRKGAESGEIKHLADSREWNQGVKERRVSAAQLWRTAIEEGAGGMEWGEGPGGGGPETQAKRLMWITVGQTSEEDKTANMSHRGLLAFNSRCFASSVSANVSPVEVASTPSASIYVNIYCFPHSLPPPSLAPRHLDGDGESGEKEQQL